MFAIHNSIFKTWSSLSLLSGHVTISAKLYSSSISLSVPSPAFSALQTGSLLRWTPALSTCCHVCPSTRHVPSCGLASATFPRTPPVPGSALTRAPHRPLAAGFPDPPTQKPESHSSFSWNLPPRFLFICRIIFLIHNIFAKWFFLSATLFVCMERPLQSL